VQRVGEGEGRGREEVGRRALLDLSGEGVRAGERVAWGGVDLREHVRQRRRGVDRQAGLRAGLRGGSDEQEEQHGDANRRRHLWIRTLVDLTRAVVGMPGRSRSSSTASRVTTATRRTGSLTTISTCAISPATFTSVTIRWKRLRAETCVPEPSLRSRSISDAGTTRRLALSRWTWIRPALSQRRRVSRLIPSADAASLAE